MNTKLDASVVLALALGCFAFPANANMKYTPEYTNGWCRVASFTQIPVQGETVAEDMGTAPGKWLEVPTGVAELSGSALSIDTDVTAPLVYTNDAAAGIYSISATLNVTLSSEPPSNDSLSGAKTAIWVCTNGVVGAGAATNWWALINGTPTTLNGTPEVDANYEIVLDSDTTDGKIRYRAKKTSDPAETEYSCLTTGTDGWVDNSASSTAISKISFAGSTTLAGFSGENFQQGYEGNGTIYDTLAKAADAAIAASGSVGNSDIYIPVAGAPVDAMTISASWITNNVPGVDWGDMGSNLNTTGPNGMTYWQSYVLGLVPSIDASKPIVQPVQNTAPDAVAFSLGGVTPVANSGVTVKYRVGAYNAPGDTTPIEGKEGTYVGVGETATADLPSSGVRYYKLDVKFE